MGEVKLIQTMRDNSETFRDTERTQNQVGREVLLEQNNEDGWEEIFNSTVLINL